MLIWRSRGISSQYTKTQPLRLCSQEGMKLNKLTGKLQLIETQQLSEICFNFYKMGTGPQTFRSNKNQKMSLNTGTSPSTSLTQKSYSKPNQTSLASIKDCICSIGHRKMVIVRKLSTKNVTGNKMLWFLYCQSMGTNSADFLRQDGPLIQGSKKIKRLIFSQLTINLNLKRLTNKAQFIMMRMKWFLSVTIQRSHLNVILRISQMHFLVIIIRCPQGSEPDQRRLSIILLGVSILKYTTLKSLLWHEYYLFLTIYIRILRFIFFRI